MISRDLLAKEVDKIIDKAVQIRRNLHMYPELGNEEVRTSALITDTLDSMGIQNRVIAGTGVSGTIYGTQPLGHAVAIRADMDALPIQDKKAVEYSSKVPSKMHACGHDAHTAILLGAAEVLNNLRDGFKGSIRLIFQPAEETTGGAKRMIDEGVLENPRVEAVVGLHVEEAIETGKIGIKYGKMNASSTPFEITVLGKSAHGAYPHKGVDAITLSAQIITGLQTIISREINPNDPAVITIGTITGGDAPNIICNKVVMKGTLRSVDSNNKNTIVKRMEEIAKGISAVLRGACEFKAIDGYPSLINDDKMIDLLRQSAEKHIGPENIIVLNSTSLGVEDFAYFSQYAPSVFYKLGCRNEGKGIINPAHSPLFDIDEDSIRLGILIQCQVVLDFLSRD